MTRGLTFYIKIYCKILAQDLKSKMSYRADFIISMIGMILTNIAGFISFRILFENFSSINGWSYHEMLFLYGFSLIAITPMQCMLDNNWSLRIAVYNGDFIKYCFRPINLFFYYESEVFDAKGLGQLAVGLTAMVYAWAQLGLEVSFLMIAKTIIFLLTASLFMMAMQNAAASACFWIDNSFYVLDLVFRLREIPDHDLQSGVPLHLHVHLPDSVHRVLS